MDLSRAVNSYKQTQAQASTPLELVVLLYDGALRFMTAAREAIERRDIRARRNALDGALSIVAELQNTLNLDRGGQIAAELDRLYGFVASRLLDAAVHNDANAVREARKVFEILRESWQTIAAAPAGVPQ